MTRSELDQLIESDHDLAAKVALAIIAAANVGTCHMEMQVDNKALEVVAKMFELTIDCIEMYRGYRLEIHLSFMEVEAVIYARVQR